MRSLTIPIVVAAVVALGACSSAHGIDPHDVYPAKHAAIPRMTYGGGRVLKAPSLVSVTFAGQDQAVRDYLHDFGANILRSGWWTAAMEGYGVGSGGPSAAVEADDIFSGHTNSDDVLSQWIARNVASRAFPYLGNETIYVVYLPREAKIELQGQTSCGAFGAYHSSAQALLDGANVTFEYALVADCTVAGSDQAAHLKDFATVAASHEIAEAATNPDVGGVKVAGDAFGYLMIGDDAWTRGGRLGNENGDLCEDSPRWREGAWLVQRIWNDASAARNGAPCVPADALFFGAAPQTDAPEPLPMDGSSGGDAPATGGYVVVHRGETRDVEVDVFSNQPLPGPLTLVAGATPPHVDPLDDPTNVISSRDGVTLTLSASSGRNGDKLTLRIAVDAGVPTAVQALSVRAILSPTQFQIWPFSLYVP